MASGADQRVSLHGRHTDESVKLEGRYLRERYTGRFLQRRCTDPNCNGELVADSHLGAPVWLCNGLTHARDDGPLVACQRVFDRNPGDINV